MSISIEREITIEEAKVDASIDICKALERGASSLTLERKGQVLADIYKDQMRDSSDDISDE